MLFRTKQMSVDFSKYALKIGDQVIDRIGVNCKEKYFKFVGHRLDEFLSWQYHINHVKGKLSSGNYAISQTKHFLPKHIRMTLYNSLCRPHMEFGIIGWAGTKTTQLKGITQVQKKCVRNVAGKGYRSHTDPIFSKLGILKFTDLFTYNCS